MADENDNNPDNNRDNDNGREAYLEAIGLSSKDDTDEDIVLPPRVRRRMALNRAHEIRKFEIGLLWQRALFFWGFQLAIFAALGGVLDIQAALIEQASSNLNNEIRSILLLALTCLGLLTSLGMVKINEGSKFWQENWEFHIDMLEDDFEGRLHKSLMSAQEKPKFYSVSKLSKITAWILVAFWTLASLVSLAWILVFLKCISLETARTLVPIGILLIIIGTAYFALKIWHCTYGSAADSKTVYLKRRETTFKTTSNNP